MLYVSFHLPMSHSMLANTLNFCYNLSSSYKNPICIRWHTCPLGPWSFGDPFWIARHLRRTRAQLRDDHGLLLICFQVNTCIKKVLVPIYLHSSILIEQLLEGFSHVGDLMEISYDLRTSLAPSPLNYMHHQLCDKSKERERVAGWIIGQT